MECSCPCMIGGPLRDETDVSEQSLMSEGRAFTTFWSHVAWGSSVVYTVTETSSLHFSCEYRHISLQQKNTYIIHLSFLKSVTMATIDLKALRFPFKDPKFIFFTDFDGTITLKDSNDFMVSSCPA